MKPDVKICIPVLEDRGLLSPVSPQFAAAPMFLVIDTSRLDLRRVPNPEPPEPGCGCDPFRALGEGAVDSFIVGGIGASALQEIARRNLPVYATRHANVADALAAFTSGKLPVLQDGATGPELPAA